MAPKNYYFRCQDCSEGGDVRYSIDKFGASNNEERLKIKKRFYEEEVNVVKSTDSTYFSRQQVEYMSRLWFHSCASYDG